MPTSPLHTIYLRPKHQQKELGGRGYLERYRQRIVSVPRLNFLAIISWHRYELNVCYILGLLPA